MSYRSIPPIIEQWLAVKPSTDLRSLAVEGVNPKCHMGMKTGPQEDDVKSSPNVGMVWEEKALEALQNVPSFVVDMVVDMTESIVKEEGADIVRFDRFQALLKSYMPENN